ncbi:MAG TPA: protein kinase [Caulifigura sp.]|nr:protein kinase [Caulifigura sp.]
MSILLTCDKNRLKDFLLGELSDRDEADLIAHLDSCSECRARLEETAGGETWRKEVGDILSASDAFQSEESTILFPVRGSDDVISESPGMAEQTLAVLKSVLGPTDNPDMLGRINSYEVVGVVGRGATGIVVKAFEPSLNRFVAIKILSPELAANAAARQRFAREAQAAAAVVNEHVVPIYAVDEYRGTPYLVMHYVSGGSLEQRLRTEGGLPLEAALRIGMQIASGLTAAHTQGLIHRDIKPANILLDHGLERVLITDFGLARAVDDASLTHSGFVAGTPQFMSPEQARGDSVDHRTDLFSLGSVLYTILAGRPPFRAETTYGILRRVCDEMHRPLGDVNRALPRWVSHLVDLFLEKDPHDRIRSAADAAILLSGCLAHVQNPATCALPREVRDSQARKLARAMRRPRVRAGALVFLICGLAATWALWKTSSRPQPVAGEHRELVHVSPTASVPVSISLVVPRPVVGTRARGLADQLELEMSALERDIQAYERKFGQRGVGLADGWRAELIETVWQMRRLETESSDDPMGPSDRTSAPGQKAAELAPPMANTKPAPIAPEYGITL